MLSSAYITKVLGNGPAPKPGLGAGMRSWRVEILLHAPAFHL